MICRASLTDCLCVCDYSPARLQWIDAKDLAEFTVSMCEARNTGIYNAVGTQTAGLGSRPTFGELLEVCVGLADQEQVKQAIAGSGDLTAAPLEVVHATAEYLVEEGVTPMTDLPMWPGGLSANTAWLFMMSNAAAVAAGLKFRSTAETARDALELAAPSMYTSSLSINCHYL